MTQKEKNTAQENVSLIRLDQMYESLRYNDYSAENGLGEIVDNSVEAKAANIWVEITSDKVKTPGKKKPTNQIVEISVTDDGYGMDQDTLNRCLALGESLRTNQKGTRGIGRFGVGMTLGGISLARRIEVYSRVDGADNFLYTYIDLDDIQKGNLLYIPTPVAQDPPTVLANKLKNSSGTIVILKHCDRVEGDMEGFANYLGRTYRKFIERSLKIFLNDQQVYLHDPLYMAGPTKFDVESMESAGLMEPKAELLDEWTIPLEIPNTSSQMAEVCVRVSLLPKEWRSFAGAGGSSEAKKRKIPQNEGVSILRADREVLYGKVPFITGVRGEAKAQDIDRWWGCEISFPPELDDYFQVRYIKRGAEPVLAVRDKIREGLQPTLKTVRDKIKREWNTEKGKKNANDGSFQQAENAMASADAKLPKKKKSVKSSEVEDEAKLDKLANAALGAEKDNPEKREKKKEEIRKKPYYVATVDYPQSILFETEQLRDNITIKLNVNHPFYKKILQPLCGDINDNCSEEDVAVGQQKRDIKNAILLLLFSYARAEAMFDDQETLFANLKSSWGTILSTALSEYSREENL